MNIDENIMVLNNLFAGYNGKSVLNGVNLSIKPGEICCILGEEGSGKSTLLKAITQQIKSKGKILYNGIDMCKVPTSKMMKIGVDFISQGGNILNGFTVEEHISLALSLRKRSEKSEIRKEIDDTFPNLFLLNKQVAGRLSGGERMILSLACLWATNANLLLMDEPTAGLSPETCNKIKDFLIMLKTQYNKSILLIEHNHEFAIEVADSLVILHNGTLSKKLTTNEFLHPTFIDNYLYGLESKSY